MTVTGALPDDPIAGVNASLSVITKGGLNTVTRQLAIEYAKEGIRFQRRCLRCRRHALHQDDLKDVLRPLGTIGTAQIWSTPLFTWQKQIK